MHAACFVKRLIVTFLQLIQFRVFSSCSIPATVIFLRCKICHKTRPITDTDKCMKLVGKQILITSTHWRTKYWNKIIVFLKIILYIRLQ